MFGGDGTFQREQMKPILQRECETKVDAESHKAIEFAFDDMNEMLRLLNTTELEELFDANQTKA